MQKQNLKKSFTNAFDRDPNDTSKKMRPSFDYKAKNFPPQQTKSNSSKSDVNFTSSPTYDDVFKDEDAESDFLSTTERDTTENDECTAVETLKKCIDENSSENDFTYLEDDILGITPHYGLCIKYDSKYVNTFKLKNDFALKVDGRWTGNFLQKHLENILHFSEKKVEFLKLETNNIYFHKEEVLFEKIEFLPPKSIKESIIFTSEQKKVFEKIYDSYREYCDEISRLSRSKTDDDMYDDDGGFANIQIQKNPDGQDAVARVPAFAIVGPAGCGKTVCIRQFLNHTELSFVYVTIQNNLCENVKFNFGLHDNQVFTLCSFLMKILKLNFYQYLKFQNLMISVSTKDLHDKFKTDDLKMNFSFLHSLFDNKKCTVLCFDEFSMINSNILCVLKKVLTKYVSIYVKRTIILLFCGDFYQIQPLFVTKQQQNRVENDDCDDEIFNNFLKRYHSLTKNSDYYCLDLIPLNSKEIINMCDDVFFFCKQMRNDNEEYQNFLKNLIQKETDKSYFLKHIFNRLSTKCSVREIPFEYPAKLLQNFPIYKDDAASAASDGYIENVVNWFSKNENFFNTFKFFSFTNLESHVLNLNVYDVAHESFSMLRKKKESVVVQQNPSQSNLYVDDSLCPKLTNVFFTRNPKDKVVNFGNFDSPRLPFLPLIIGMEYKILKSGNFLKRGQLVKLVHIGVNESTRVLEYLLVYYTVKNNEKKIHKILKLLPSHYLMNLFSKHHWRYNDKRETEESKKLYPQIGLLYGFPLQLAVADTVRGSIGTTVENKLFANLGGCSIEEIYVLLSRVRSEQHIQGINLGITK